MSRPNHIAPEHAAALQRRLITAYQRSALVVAALLSFSLVIGMVGYHALAPMPWVDAFVNAAMLLGGMGPVDTLTNDAVKVFAGAYALYCGVVFIATTGLLIGPLARHILHRFHLEQRS